MAEQQSPYLKALVPQVSKVLFVQHLVATQMAAVVAVIVNHTLVRLRHEL